jgi:hypothetical protein
MAAAAAAIFVLHVLQDFPKHFQWLSLRVGNPMRHACNMIQKPRFDPDA